MDYPEIVPIERTTDWNSLWRELVALKLTSRKRRFGPEQASDLWTDRALKFDEGVQRRWSKPDSSRAFILQQVGQESSVLDIGAGTGAWSVLLASRAKHVTAVEPSESMIEVMRRRLAAEGIANVTILQGNWPDVSVPRCDYSLCSHAMYGYPDLAAFIRRMVECTSRKCFLLLRAPAIDGIGAEAARHIWNHPFDSPNFIIAYNILLQLGIYANVLMEDTGLWESKRSASLEEAMRRLKRRFGLLESHEHDEFLMDLLRRRLTVQDGEYVWPPEVCSALVYWSV